MNDNSQVLGKALRFIFGMAVLLLAPRASVAQMLAPSVVDPNLAVRTVVRGLDTPTSVAFLGPGDLLVLEKNTGRVQRVVNGVIQGTVLDLAVNSASERGLLGIALHPDFPRAGAELEEEREGEHGDNPGVYLYWTESLTGADSSSLADVPLLGNRVDRFVWDGSRLVFDRNLIKLRSFQADAGHEALARVPAAFDLELLVIDVQRAT